MRFRFAALAFAFTGLGFGNAEAGANRDWYGTLEFGADWTGVDGTVVALPLGSHLHGGQEYTVDLDSGWGGFATLGAMIGPNVRIEGEIGYRSGDGSATETVSQTTLMVNALYSLPIMDKLNLIAGGGIGADLVSWDRFNAFGPDSSDNQTLFAYQGIVGLTYDLTDNVALVAKYRYLRASGDMPGVESDAAVIDGNDTSSQTVVLGLKFGF